jgi:hypothetical protein
MNKRISLKHLLAATLLIGAVMLSSCAAAPAAVVSAPAPAQVAQPTNTASAIANVDDDGNTSIDLAALNSALSQVSTGQLTMAEAEALRYMREEEKLAHDVYLALYEKWGLQIFYNISNSEQTHTDAIKTLLDRYGVADPAAGKAPGVFTDSKLQDLYNQLVEQGRKSLADALRAGAAIEEIDILDLEERIAQTDKTDVRLVYDNLTKGSRNHLRSFVSTLKTQTSATYQPQYLSQGAYQAVVGSTIERGRAGGRP